VTLSLIAAMAADRIIGNAGTLPWRLPEDMQFFRQTTTGHSVVMGRKTFDSIGKPLAKRRNLVVSRDSSLRSPGVEFFSSLDAALLAAKDEAEVFVIGGMALYQLALPLADRLLLTEIERAYPGDTRFPEIGDAFVEVRRERKIAVSDPTLAYSFVEYRRS
jgi:dihydrofolate reductase